MTTPANSNFPTTLVFDTTNRDQTSVALIKAGQVDILVRPVRAQDLQQLMQELLAGHNLALADVAGIGVLTGPGSFTGTRIGITVANTLGWLTGQKLYELPGSDIKLAIDLLLAGKIKVVRQIPARS